MSNKIEKRILTQENLNDIMDYINTKVNISEKGKKELRANIEKVLAEKANIEFYSNKNE